MSRELWQIIKNKIYKTCILICCYSRGQKCHAKKSRKETKIQEFIYKDTTYVEYEIIVTPVTIGATGIATKALNKNLEAIPGKHSI